MVVVRPYFTEDQKVLPFDKVIELEKIDDWTFLSIVRAYSPTGGENGTYGGHVFAQAAWAAAQTVGEGFLIHVSWVGTSIAPCSQLYRTSPAGSSLVASLTSTTRIE